MDKRKLSNEIMRPKKHVPVVVHPLVRDQFGIFWRQLVFSQAKSQILRICVNRYSGFGYFMLEPLLDW